MALLLRTWPSSSSVLGSSLQAVCLVKGQTPCCLQVLGCLLIAGGVLSVLGSMHRNANMLTGALAAALIGMLLAFTFVAQVRQSCIQPEHTASYLERACFLIELGQARAAACSFEALSDACRLAGSSRWTVRWLSFTPSRSPPSS